MTSSRPYLIRALYQWITDNELTPHIVVDADAPGASVPGGTAQDGKIVFNIAAPAVRALELGNEQVTFEARFGGVSQRVAVPVGGILAVYARENGQGMMFPPEEEDSAPAPEAPKSGPVLKVVK